MASSHRTKEQALVAGNCRRGGGGNTGGQGQGQGRGGSQGNQNQSQNQQQINNQRGRYARAGEVIEETEEETKHSKVNQGIVIIVAFQPTIHMSARRSKEKVEETRKTTQKRNRMLIQVLRI